jgi:hypothetical protein
LGQEAAAGRDRENVNREAIPHENSKKQVKSGKGCCNLHKKALPAAPRKGDAVLTLGIAMLSKWEETRGKDNGITVAVFPGRGGGEPSKHRPSALPKKRWERYLES